jgi:hypothetical protein
MRIGIVVAGIRMRESPRLREDILGVRARDMRITTMAVVGEFFLRSLLF